MQRRITLFFSALALLLCALSLAPEPAAAAEPLVQTADAKGFDRLVKEANKNFKGKNYDKALELFHQAYELDPVPNLLYNVARVLEAKGAFPEAIESYKKFIASPGIDHKARQDAITRLKTLIEVVELTAGQNPTSPTTKPVPTDGAIDINSAGEAQLVTLHGIGPSKARAIINDREKNGPFETVDALVRVRGIGQKTLEKLRPYVIAAQPQAPPDAPLAPEE